jgi:HPt (histidine-containing phosphotransfer) domain-containing protein
MTANAMASDRQACLAAGMNDHVGKPFDLDHLVSVLRKHAGRQQSSESRAPARPLALPEAVSGAADEAGVDIGAALNRLGNQRGVYQRMLRGFVRDLAAMPDQMRAQVAQGDGAHLARLLHTLKGLAATLGAKRLSAAAAGAEKAVTARMRGATAPEDALAAPELQADIAAVVAAIEVAGPGLASLLQALQALDAPPTPAADAPAAPVVPASATGGDGLLSCLRLLATQLADADMAATDTMATLTQRFGATLGARLTPLDEALLGLDFELGLRLCASLVAEIANESNGNLPA